jgi:7,8-dihydroneopterin aldolase/epimerase/oxygenase
VSDRIVLHNMVFEGRHGYYEHEQATAQPFEVDVEMRLDLQQSGVDDDLEKTVDYGKVFDVTREVVESTRLRLLEAIAETIGREVLAGFPPVEEVCVRVRKPRVQLGGRLDYAGVEITRRRSDG